MAKLAFILLALAGVAQAQFREDALLREIITLNQEAETHEDWHRNEAQIELLRGRLSGLFSFGGGVDPSRLCESMQRLTDEELMHFYEHVARVDTGLPFNCRRDLQFRINSFLQASATALTASRPKLSPCRADTARAPQPTAGPTVEVELDNARAQTVVNASLPACHVNLTFDDGPHSSLTPELLNILSTEKVRVNFFVLGNNVARYPEIVARAHAEGHVVGNHTMNHKNLPKLTEQEARDEIADGFTQLLGVFSEYVPFFRFPYGAHTAKLKQYAYGRRWLDFFWNMDTLDWKINDPEKLYRNVLMEIEREKRGVILFHDIHPQTLVTIPFVLAALNEAGYTTVVFTPKEVLQHVAH